MQCFALGIEAASFFLVSLQSGSVCENKNIATRQKKDIAESPTHFLELPLNGLLIGQLQKWGTPKC